MASKKSKKWIIALAILVLIAVVVVCIIVFIPKNTDNVLKQTYSQKETMFLKSDEDEKMFASFERKIQLNASEYTNEITSARKISNTLNNIIYFYSENIVFAQNNATFQSNYNLIMDNYGHANNYQERMTDKLTEIYNKVDSSSTFTAGAWEEFKGIFVNYVKCYSNSIKGLNKVYRDCVNDGIIHNDLTFLVLDTVDNYLEVINKDFTENRYVVNYANAFVNNYLVSYTTNLSGYKFSTATQDKVKLIHEFESVYGKGQNIKAVIESIGASGITYQTKPEDNKGVLEQVKTLLNGGLR